jgi:hypothetical protein
VPDASCPLRECQLDQEVPSFVVVFDQTAPSVPRTKTSQTPLTMLGVVAAGDDVADPPMELQPPVPFIHQT